MQLFIQSTAFVCMTILHTFATFTSKYFERYEKSRSIFFSNVLVLLQVQMQLFKVKSNSEQIKSYFLVN